MITSLIICTLSAIFFAVLCYSKKLELDRGRALIRVGSSSMDNRLQSYYEKQREFIASIDTEYIKEKFHLIAEKAEHWGLRMGEKLVNKFGRAKDMVTGKDLPKNKGAVSFFLKHIESHKNQVKSVSMPSVAQTIKEKAPLTEADIDPIAMRLKMDQVDAIFNDSNGQSYVQKG